MKEVLKIKVEKPQYVAITGITYAQVDSWYGHCRRDLKLDLIYPEDFSGKTYPYGFVAGHGFGWTGLRISLTLANWHKVVLSWQAWNTVLLMRESIQCRFRM